MTDTILSLIGVGIPQYSARGLVQTLTPIAASIDQRRTINGALVDLSYSQFRKYISKITCNDQRTPAIDGIWPGAIVTVDCVCELSYPVGRSPANARPEVSGSSRVENGFVFYRPILQMMITAISNQIDEYKADYQWEIDLEEI